MRCLHQILKAQETIQKKRQKSRRIKGMKDTNKLRIFKAEMIKAQTETSCTGLAQVGCRWDLSTKRGSGQTSPSLTKMISPIDYSLKMNKTFSPKGTHWRRVGQMPSSRGKQNTNSLTSLEVSCLMLSCQGFLYHFILYIYFPYFF